MDSCGPHGLDYIAMWDPHRNLLLGRYRLVKNMWLFLNKSKDLYNDYNSELYIYKINNIANSGLTQIKYEIGYCYL